MVVAEAGGVVHIVPQTIYNIYINDTDRAQLLAEADRIAEEVDFDRLPGFSALLGTLQWQERLEEGAPIGREVEIAVTFEEEGDSE